MWLHISILNIKEKHAGENFTVFINNQIVIIDVYFFSRKRNCKRSEDLKIMTTTESGHQTRQENDLTMV